MLPGTLPVTSPSCPAAGGDGKVGSHPISSGWGGAQEFILVCDKMRWHNKLPWLSEISTSPQSPQQEHLSCVPALLWSCHGFCHPSDGLGAISMLEAPHGWALAIPPRRKKALLHLEPSGSSCTKAGQGRSHCGRGKVKPSGATVQQAHPCGTGASQLKADNSQHPDYWNAFSTLHCLLKE